MELVPVVRVLPKTLARSARRRSRTARMNIQPTRNALLFRPARAGACLRTGVPGGRESTGASELGRGMDRTPDTFATLPRDEMATLLAHAYAAGFDRAACDAALSRSKPLPEWCRAEVLLHHDMSRQIFTHVPLRDGHSVSATCKTWASTFWLQESTADADWVLTHQGGISVVTIGC